MKGLIILLMSFLILSPGCNRTRSLSKKNYTISVDSSSKTEVKKDISWSESIRLEAVKKAKESSKTENVSITKGEKEVKVDAYSVTANFTIDTTARGDTIRLVSQENENVKFSIYYDKKSGQAVAQIEGKERKIKTTFDQVTISNAVMSKDQSSSDLTKSNLTKSDLTKSVQTTAVDKTELDKVKNLEVENRSSVWIWVTGIALICLTGYFGFKLLARKIPNLNIKQ